MTEEAHCTALSPCDLTGGALDPETIQASSLQLVPLLTGNAAGAVRGARAPAGTQSRLQQMGKRGTQTGPHNTSAPLLRAHPCAGSSRERAAETVLLGVGSSCPLHVSVRAGALSSVALRAWRGVAHVLLANVPLVTL